MHATRRPVTALTTLTLAWCLTGCGGDADPSDAEPGPSQPSEETTSPALIDPPMRFDPERGVELPDDEIALTEDGVGYTYDEAGLSAVDLSSGEPVWTLPSDSWNLGTGAPAYADVDGRRVVFGAFAGSTTGSGTAKDSHQVHVVAVDAETGEELWSTAAVEQADVGMEANVVAADGNAVVVAVTDYQSHSDTAVVLDAGSGEVGWTKPGLLATDLDGDVVSGTRQVEAGGYGDSGTFQAAGLSTASGDEVWAGAVLEYPMEHDWAPANPDPGPGLTQVVGRIEEGGLQTVLLDPATGHPKITHPGYYACHDDRKSTIVCMDEEYVGGPVPMEVTAYDATSLTPLWTIAADDPNRDVPRLQTAWHGAVYTGAGGVLDALTGEDRATEVGIEGGPWYVTAGFGVTGGDYPEVFPAVE